ncbi:MAG: heterocyst frequency control protein PatD [Xenococcaceae cyanobacterium]
MLPKLHCQAYQEFLTALLELRDRATAPNLEAASLQENFKQVQQVFQGQIMILTSDGLDPAIAPRWQSVQTELHRALRLLEMDIMFLCSSRQAATAGQRLASVSDRLEKIIGYCQLLLQCGERI